VLEINCHIFGEFVALLQFLGLMFLVLEHCMHFNEKVQLLGSCHSGYRRVTVGHNRWWKFVMFGRSGQGVLGFGGLFWVGDVAMATGGHGGVAETTALGGDRWGF
jgi:hypothetical protein